MKNKLIFYNELKKTSVILTIFLTIITAGIYYPVWFLINQTAINNLQSKGKISAGVTIFAIIVFIISFLVPWDILSSILIWIAEITLLFQCFMARGILHDHFNVHLKKDIHFSGIAIFFFQIFYLQYKINSIIDLC